MLSIRKLACVISIGQYADENHIPNAISDAENVTKKLKDIGFEIDEPKLNLTCRNMKRMFYKKSGDLVLFYFSDHGTQWEDQKYLIPSYNLDRINSRKPLATIFLLDCCRIYCINN